MAIRLAHLSDIHITTRPLGWRLRDWFDKRLTGWVNYRCLGRGYRFRMADAVLASLVGELREQKPDSIVFSGDASALGFDAEFRQAAALLGCGRPDMLPGLAVPGNHDYYTIKSATEGAFERHFQPWQIGEREGGAIYPFAQRVGHLWVIAVNSCTGNRRTWDAGGAVDAPQLARLRALLARPAAGPRILVTHYPVALADGKPEKFYHGLRNLGEVVDAAARGGVGLWLHGHRHGAFHHPAKAVAPFPVICAGSATQNQLWSYQEYVIDGYHLEARRRAYDLEERCFREVERFELNLTGDPSG